MTRRPPPKNLPSEPIATWYTFLGRRLATYRVFRCSLHRAWVQAVHEPDTEGVRVRFGIGDVGPLEYVEIRGFYPSREEAITAQATRMRQHVAAVKVRAKAMVDDAMAAHSEFLITYGHEVNHAVPE